MNLALLRVCAIIFIVYILGMVSNLFFVCFHSSLFATLWNALVISSFEDIVAMAGLFIASGLIGPVGLAVAQQVQQRGSDVGLLCDAGGID